MNWVQTVATKPHISQRKTDGVEIVDATSVFVADTQSASQMKHNIDRALRAASLGSAVIALSPVALNHVGIGKREFEFLGRNGSCCQLISAHGPAWGKTKEGEQTYGVAGALAAAFSHLPMLGDDLSKGGLANALGAGGIVVAGHYAGNALEKRAQAKGKDGKLGRAICTGSKLLGFTVALPALLPGVGHGVEFLSSVANIDDLNMDNTTANGPGVKLMSLLGKNPGVCKGNDKLADGAMSAASVPIAQLCCALPALIASIPMIWDKTRKEQGQER